MAEELGKGLQNLLHECESRTRLQLKVTMTKSFETMGGRKVVFTKSLDLGPNADQQNINFLLVPGLQIGFAANYHSDWWRYTSEIQVLEIKATFTGETEKRKHLTRIDDVGIPAWDSIEDTGIPLFDIEIGRAIGARRLAIGKIAIGGLAEGERPSMPLNLREIANVLNLPQKQATTPHLKQIHKGSLHYILPA